ILRISDLRFLSRRNRHVQAALVQLWSTGDGSAGVVVNLDLPQYLARFRVNGINVRRLVSKVGCESRCGSFLAARADCDSTSDACFDLNGPINATSLRVEREEIALRIADVKPSPNDNGLRAAGTRPRK